MNAHTARPTSAQPTAVSYYYVPLPARLLRDLCNNPLAIGIFALIARRFRVSPDYVPLSVADIQIVDPSISKGAANRAIQRLVNTGYLLPDGDAGRKGRYMPAWGRVGNTPRPFDTTAPGLGRPHHLESLRIDQRLVDTYIGRLDPHYQHPARVARLTTAPLLGLADVGAYAMAQAGLPAPKSLALARLGLIDAAGTVRALPDDTVLLARVSQRAALDPNAPALTAAGWARTAFAVAGQTPTEDRDTPASPPLFFLPPEQIGPMIGGMIGGMIGDVIGDVIGQADSCQMPNSPSVCKKIACSDARDASHGSEGSESTTTHKASPHSSRHGGGGDSSSHHHRPHIVPQEDSAPHQSEASSAQGAGHTTSATPPPPPPLLTQAEQRLLNIGVRRDVARSLADRSEAQVDHVIAQVQDQQGVRNRAAWVVSALRALPATEMPYEPPLPRPSALPIHIHPGLSDTQRDRWIWRFRAATTAYEQHAILRQLATEHPIDDNPTASEEYGGPSATHMPLAQTREVA